MPSQYPCMQPCLGCALQGILHNGPSSIESSLVKNASCKALPPFSLAEDEHLRVECLVTHRLLLLKLPEAPPALLLLRSRLSRQCGVSACRAA